jgi:subtilisin family serine protease
MRSLLLRLIALLLATSPTLALARGDDATGRYIITFAEPPAAMFAALQAESALDGSATKPAGASAASRRLDPQAAGIGNYRRQLADLRVERLQSAADMLSRPLQPIAAFDLASHAVVVAVDEHEAALLASLPGVTHVEPDRWLEPLSDASARWTGADLLWQGIDGIASQGEGVVIGIFDGGINWLHPSFAATAIDGHVHSNPRGSYFGSCRTNPAICNTKLIGVHDMTVCEPAFENCTDNEHNSGFDRNGHGSHVASIAAGNPIDADLTTLLGGNPGSARIAGIAPRANLISYKVCETLCSSSWIMAALEQAVAKEGRYRQHVAGLRRR